MPKKPFRNRLPQHQKMGQLISRERERERERKIKEKVEEYEKWERKREREWMTVEKG